MGQVQVFPRQARSILTRTGGYLEGFTHTLQPYVGCEFSCLYCYVRELMVQRANRHRLPWSHWLEPKLNAPELLERDALRGKLAQARIFLSSSTDPYTPAERRYRLTRACLEVLAAHPPAALVLQTRSPLVCRDRDLLARIPSALVSVTVTTDDERVRRLLEPNAPSITRRIDALAELRAAGIATQAAVSPLLPSDPEALARRLEPVAQRVVVDDFFQGDGAGGRRSRRALDRLRELGFERWTEPGYAHEAVRVFQRVFGSERVGVSREGFVAPARRAGSG
jgi:DNA repair photolyase